MEICVEVGSYQGEYFAYRFSKEQWDKVIEKNGNEQIRDVRNWTELAGSYMDQTDNLECEFQDMMQLGSCEMSEVTVVDENEEILYECDWEDVEEIFPDELDDYMNGVSNSFSYDENDEMYDIVPSTPSYEPSLNNCINEQEKITRKEKGVLVVVVDVQKPGLNFNFDIEGEFDPTKLHFYCDIILDCQPIVTGAMYNGKMSETEDWDSYGTIDKYIYILDCRENERASWKCLN